MLFFTRKTNKALQKEEQRYVEEIKKLDGSWNADHSNMPELRYGKCQ